MCLKKGKVCDVTYKVWVVLLQHESVVKLATVGWKWRVCDVDPELVDLEMVATWEVDLGTKKVGHHWYIAAFIVWKKWNYCNKSGSGVW